MQIDGHEVTMRETYEFDKYNVTDYVFDVESQGWEGSFHLLAPTTWPDEFLWGWVQALSHAWLAAIKEGRCQQFFLVPRTESSREFMADYYGVTDP